MNVILETPRLVLRQFTLNDAPLILELNKDPEVTKYLHEPLLENEQQAKDIIQNIILPQYENRLGRWAVHIKSDGTFIGWCGLKFVADRNEIDLGYRFKRDSWGKGYGTEAAQFTLAYGFNDLQLQTIAAMAHIHNTASLKIIEKIGMRFMKEDIVDHCPVKTYKLSASEYSFVK